MVLAPKKYGSHFPITGRAWPGYANCQRMIIIKLKPKKRKTRPQRPYWIPIILWSVEKMYVRHQPSSWCSCSPAWACGSWCVSKEVEASIREKVTLSILKEKASLQSPNLIDCRSCVGRKSTGGGTLLLQIPESPQRSRGCCFQLGNNLRRGRLPTADTSRRRYFRPCDRFGINRRFQKVQDLNRCLQRLGAKIFKANAEIIFTKNALAVIGSLRIDPLPHQCRAFRHGTKQTLAPAQHRGTVFVDLILVFGKRHVAAVAQYVNESQLRELSVQEWEQINTSWRLPAPARPASLHVRDMTRESSVKILFHPRRLPRRYFFSTALR